MSPPRAPPPATSRSSGSSGRPAAPPQSNRLSSSSYSSSSSSLSRSSSSSGRSASPSAKGGVGPAPSSSAPRKPSQAAASTSQNSSASSASSASSSSSSSASSSFPAAASAPAVLHRDSREVAAEVTPIAPRLALAAISPPALPSSLPALLAAPGAVAKRNADDRSDARENESQEGEGTRGAGVGGGQNAVSAATLQFFQALAALEGDGERLALPSAAAHGGCFKREGKDDGEGAEDAEMLEAGDDEVKDATETCGASSRFFSSFQAAQTVAELTLLHDLMEPPFTHFASHLRPAGAGDAKDAKSGAAPLAERENGVAAPSDKTGACARAKSDGESRRERPPALLQQVCGRAMLQRAFLGLAAVRTLDNALDRVWETVTECMYTRQKVRRLEQEEAAHAAQQEGEDAQKEAEKSDAAGSMKASPSASGSPLAETSSSPDEKAAAKDGEASQLAVARVKTPAAIEARMKKLEDWYWQVQNCLSPSLTSDLQEEALGAVASPSPPSSSEAASESSLTLLRRQLVQLQWRSIPLDVLRLRAQSRTLCSLQQEAEDLLHSVAHGRNFAVSEEERAKYRQLLVHRKTNEENAFQTPAFDAFMLHLRARRTEVQAPADGEDAHSSLYAAALAAVAASKAGEEGCERAHETLLLLLNSELQERIKEKEKLEEIKRQREQAERQEEALSVKASQFPKKLRQLQQVLKELDQMCVSFLSSCAADKKEVEFPAEAKRLPAPLLSLFSSFFFHSRLSGDSAIVRLSVEGSSFRKRKREREEAEAKDDAAKKRIRADGADDKEKDLRESEAEKMGKKEESETEKEQAQDAKDRLEKLHEKEVRVELAPDPHLSLPPLFLAAAGSSRTASANGGGASLSSGKTGKHQQTEGEAKRPQPAELSSSSVFPLALVFRYNASLEVALLHSRLPSNALPHPTIPFLHHLFPGNFADLGEMPGDLDPNQGWLFNWVASMACLPPPPGCCASAHVNMKDFLAAVRRRVYARLWSLQLLHHYCRQPSGPPPVQALHSLLLLLPSPGTTLADCVCFSPIPAEEFVALSAASHADAALFSRCGAAGEREAAAGASAAPSTGGRKKTESESVWRRLHDAFFEDEDAVGIKAIFASQDRRVFALIKVFLNDNPAQFRLFEENAPPPLPPSEGPEMRKERQAEDGDAAEGDDAREERRDESEETTPAASLEALEEMVNVTVVDRFASHPPKLSLGILAAQVEYLKCGVERYVRGEALPRSATEAKALEPKKGATHDRRMAGGESLREAEGFGAGDEEDVETVD
ncbi:hypothetical protein BESB_083040 [Besnoitia besnoiti]|uniref:Fms-interacting protein n=1 Tax=Besnoitia besnoiti TaxID=94643 RepID=A0A2A9M563_BESBE|nr:hypothetical protein BESB_083040 [Besnoitia besnoiti]PFH33105.1 hypothetical protein BESB_083040 [Besnoitia besnoiti]